jgi:hypothetical protein
MQIYSSGKKMNLSFASRCIGIYEMKIAENFAHRSTDKSFISNLVTSIRKPAGRGMTCKQDPPATGEVDPEAPFAKEQVRRKTPRKQDPPATSNDLETPSFLQEHDDHGEQESVPILCHSIIGCTILVSTVDSNAEFDAVEDDELFTATWTPIAEEEDIIMMDAGVCYPTKVLSPSMPDHHRGFFLFLGRSGKINHRQTTQVHDL